MSASCVDGPFGARGEIGDAASVGCGHVSGLLTRHLWPLALMKSADRVPISLSRTERLRHCGLIQSPARPVRHHVLPPLHSLGWRLQPAEGSACYTAGAV
jgi:hypothetical protein